jgi:CheY-like chemotaxis protein
MERLDFKQWSAKEVARLLALVEAERRYYQHLVAALPVPLAVLSTERAILSANRAFRQTFAARPEELAGKSIEQILPSEILVEKIRDAHVHGIPQPGFPLDLGARRFRVSIVPIRNRDDDGEEETLLMVEDASATAAPADAPAAPHGLAGRLAHDINNPLMIVTGYSEELLESLPADDPRRKDVEQILAAAERISGITAELLAFTRKQAGAEPPPAGEARETVLVVDDEEGIRALVRKILRRERYRVLEAGSAEEALGVAAAHGGRIDLLLTDVLLPGASGRTLTERLRAIRPDLKVLYISGHTGGEAVPGSRLLEKPFTLGTLVSKVREALEG